MLLTRHSRHPLPRCRVALRHTSLPHTGHIPMKLTEPSWQQEAHGLVPRRHLPLPTDTSPCQFLAAKHISERESSSHQTACLPSELCTNDVEFQGCSSHSSSAPPLPVPSPLGFSPYLSQSGALANGGGTAVRHPHTAWEHRSACHPALKLGEHEHTMHS